jgi:hypothetical protein
MARDWYPNKSNKKGAAAPSKHADMKSRHSRERRQAHDRHARERADVASRHEAELAALASQHDSEIADASSAAAPNGPGAPTSPDDRGGRDRQAMQS